MRITLTPPNHKFYLFLSLTWEYLRLYSIRLIVFSSIIDTSSITRTLIFSSLYYLRDPGSIKGYSIPSYKSNKAWMVIPPTILAAVPVVAQTSKFKKRQYYTSMRMSARSLLFPVPAEPVINKRSYSDFIWISSKTIESTPI